MKLWLLRHAQAEPWNSAYPHDQDRPLTEQGRLDCQHLNRWLHDHPHLRAGTILVSPALRTQETAQIVLNGLDWKAGISSETLWAASRSSLERLITVNADHPSPLLLIGHNPGLSELLAWLTDSSFGSMRPGTLVRLDLSLPLHAGSGEIEGSVQPSDFT